jgi:tetratricopeptide (TPR) repeat protein
VSQACAEAFRMKHVKEATALLESGDAPGALGILEDILSLAPRNSEALRLKARLLDAWGRFDEALHVLHALSQLSNLNDQELRDIEARAMEEKETIVYSELSAEGRWYFAFPVAQIWISLYGFLGCAAFLLLSPSLLSGGAENFPQLASAFALFVVVPWLALLVVHVTGIKRILVGVGGLRVCRRFAQSAHPWSSFAKAVVEYDHDINSGYLRLHLYGTESATNPSLSFDISSKSAVVKARRHFVRNVLSYLDVVCYLPRGAVGLGGVEWSFADGKLNQKTSTGDDSSDQNTGSAA